MATQQQREQGVNISDADARRLAAEYHDGALLALASTGTINPAVRLEVLRDLQRPDWTRRQRRELQSLARYVETRPNRGPVDGWSDLPWSDLASVHGSATMQPQAREVKAEQRRAQNMPVVVVESLSGKRTEVWSAPIDDVLMWAENVFPENDVIYRQTTLREELAIFDVEPMGFSDNHEFVEAAIRALGGEEQEAEIADELRNGDPLDWSLVNSDYLNRGGSCYTFEQIEVKEVIKNAFDSLPGTNSVKVYDSTAEALADDLSEPEQEAVLRYVVENEFTVAETFFFKHGPVSRDMKVETQATARVRCAREAAAAEAEAKGRGWSLGIEPSGEQYGQQGDDFDVVLDPRRFKGELFTGYDVRLYDEKGTILESLGGVTFPENDSEDTESPRVLFADLADAALERLLAQERKLEVANEGSATERTVMFGRAVRQPNGLYKLIEGNAKELFATKEEAQRALMLLRENNTEEKIAQTLGGNAIGVVEVPVWHNTGDLPLTVFDDNAILDTGVSRGTTVTADDAAVKQKERSPLPGI